MRKMFIITAVGMLCVSAVRADFVMTPVGAPKNNGGFIAGRETIVTVSQVKEMRDDVNVIVQGNIVQRVGDDKYLFEDNTGSITVEIDDKDWRGQTVSPSDTVKLHGDVDRGFLNTEIDVDYVEKL